MVTLFKKALGGCFATYSLKTLNKNFFRAPLHRIKEEHPDLLPMFSEESKEANLLDRLYLGQKLLLIGASSLS